MDAKIKQVLGQAKEAYENDEYERAEPLLRQVLDEGGEGFADVHHMLGQIHHDRGDFGRAQEYFETAVRINPRYTDALLALAVVYNDLGKYEDSTRVQAFARKHVEEHEGAIDPFVAGKIANMHADLASVYMEAGLPEEAIHEYERALKLCPHFADLQTRLAHVYREMGRHDDARVHYEAALEQNDKYVPARIHLGLLLLRLGKKDDAKDQWHLALSVDPDNKSARMYLKTFLKEEAEDLPIDIAVEHPAENEEAEEEDSSG
jgi:tetratricopeptide (TPR) repeat protein